MFIASREFDNKGVSTWEELDLHFLKWKLQFSNNTENLSNILLASSVYIESGVQYQSRSFFSIIEDTTESHFSMCFQIWYKQQVAKRGDGDLPYVTVWSQHIA